MKIITYNVNGIRAAIKKGFLEWLAQENPDVLCIQETKAQPDQIPVFEFTELGYHTQIHSAEKKGYSGVAILSKQEPIHVEIGMGIEKYDREGRFLRADFQDYSVVSAYHPSGSSGDLRQEFKMQWLADYQKYVLQLQKKHPNLVLSGDYNICHRAIDIHDPVRNAKSSGFLPEEREWMSQFLESGFVDSYRYLYPDKAHHYSWWSYRANARNNNKGWRLDYNMTSKTLEKRIEKCDILTEIKHSDHCPASLTLKF